MTKPLAIAALLLVSTAAAQAQYTFDYGGRTIRIDPDRGTVSIPGIYDNTGRHSRRAKSDTTDRKRKPAQQTRSDPQVAPAAPPASAASPTEQTAVPASPPPAATVGVAPSDTAAAPPPRQQQAAPAANAVQAANSPLGVWLTEEREGKVRIEQCGANLCGYSVDKTSNQNREQILINMKPGKDKWSGRIVDPDTGSSYDSTIALKGADTLRVQGCAFGGMFCGGQTWTRVN